MRSPTEDLPEMENGENMELRDGATGAIDSFKAIQSREIPGKNNFLRGFFCGPEINILFAETNGTG